MSQEVKEKISSFYDDELDASDRDHIVKHLKDDEDVQKTWYRYGLIGDAMKKDLPNNIEHNLFDRIQLAMESEPTHFAPSGSNVKQAAPENVAADVVSLAKKSSNEKVSHPAWGFGIAATVALVSVLGFQMFSSGADTTLQPELVAASNSGITQELNISSSIDVSVPEISVTEEATASAPTYAEQSIMDDGQWTRITPIDGASIENELLSNRAGSRSGIDLNDNLSPLARSVSLNKSSSD